MQCPHDSQKLTMKADVEGGYVAYSCAACHGAWLPPRYFTAIKYSRDFDTEAFLEQVKNKATYDSELACPSGCGQLKTAAMEGVDLDYCPRCRGIWFDQFEMLSAFIAGARSFDDVDLDSTEAFSGFRSNYKNLQLVRSRIQRVQVMDVNRDGHFRGFLSSAKYAISLLFKEKELLLFALLQWLVIMFAYLLWVQMLNWIPEEVWRSAADAEGASLPDLVLIAWSFVCIGVAAYPVGILTGCMGACHFLRTQHEESSIRRCVELVLPKAGSLWAFHWFDGWITCERILDRLPKKDDRRSSSERLLAETMYFAWKVGVAGMLPALLTGNSFLGAAKKSLFFAKDNMAQVVKLRAGYSALCWIVGVGAYIFSMLWFFATDFFGSEDELYGRVYEFYLWATVPIMVALAFVMLLLRPVYVIAVCDMYSEHLEKTGSSVMMDDTRSNGGMVFFIFLALCAATAIAYIFRDELGIVYMLSVPYQN